MTTYDLNRLTVNFRSRMVFMGDCWIWKGGTNGKRHGYDSTNNITTHKLTYLVFKGDIPEGYELHHTCLNTLCCNPDHVTPLTRSEHKRGHMSYITKCPYGHEYTEENTLAHWAKTRKGRRCKTCRRLERVKKRRER